MSVKYVSKGMRSYEESMRRFHGQGLTNNQEEWATDKIMRSIAKDILPAYCLFLSGVFCFTYMTTTWVENKMDTQKAIFIPRTIERVVRTEKEREAPEQKRDERQYAGAENNKNREVPGPDKLPNEEKRPEQYAIVPRDEIREVIAWCENESSFRGKNENLAYRGALFDQRTQVRRYLSPRGNGHRGS